MHDQSWPERNQEMTPKQIVKRNVMTWHLQGSKICLSFTLANSTLNFCISACSSNNPPILLTEVRVKCWDAHHTFQPRLTIHLHWHCQTKNKNYPFPSIVSQANPCNVSAPMSQMPQMIWIERFKLDFNPHKILAPKEGSFFFNWHTSRQVQHDWNCVGWSCRRDSVSSPRLPPSPTWTPNSNIHKACSWREHQQTRGRFSNK